MRSTQLTQQTPSARQQPRMAQTLKTPQRLTYVSGRLETKQVSLILSV